MTISRLPGFTLNLNHRDWSVALMHSSKATCRVPKLTPRSKGNACGQVTLGGSRTTTSKLQLAVLLFRSVTVTSTWLVPTGKAYG